VAYEDSKAHRYDAAKSGFDGHERLEEIGVGPFTDTSLPNEANDDSKKGVEENISP
jgi:hypothetical protein